MLKALFSEAEKLLKSLKEPQVGTDAENLMATITKLVIEVTASTHQGSRDQDKTPPFPEANNAS